MNQAQFAEFIGVTGENGQSTVSKWESGKQLPGSEYTAKLAQKSGMSSVYFSGLTPISTTESNSRSYPLIGEIQAGNWREAYSLEEQDDVEYVSLPHAMGARPYKMKAFLVRGSSMDLLYPDGSIVFIAGIWENHINPVDGDVVAIQRENEMGLIEASLKELVVDESGRKWLWPRSSDPEHQSPLSINDGRNLSTDVRILGIVEAAIVKPRRISRRTPV